MTDQESLKPKLGYVHDAPFEASLLKVDEIHSIHYEQYGLKDGLPVVFLHGGPGGQTSAANTVFFNPEKYRVVLFDQRGAGRSQPRNEIRDNTTHHLVADIEKLREHLNIKQWHMVFGGSWGTTLGLLYTQTHPERVKSLVLRGVTTLRKRELLHSRRGPNGAAKFYPDMYDRFIDYLPAEERHDPIAGYYKQVTSEDPAVVATATREWNHWDLTLNALQLMPDAYSMLDDYPEWCYTHALMETHYFHHAAWLQEGQLLANVDKMKHIPGAIVQGRYDLITPPQTAWELHKVWPKSSIHWIPDAGHTATEPRTMAKLIEVCDEFAKL